MLHPKIHIISAGKHGGNWHHPDEMYIGTVLRPEIQNCLLDGTKHGVSFYNIEANEFNFLPTNKMLFTTHVPVNEYISFVFLPLSDKLEAYVYRPGTVDIAKGDYKPLLQWDDTFTPTPPQSTQPSPPPPTFTFEHRGHTLWQ
jgi:hypothetical protein